jgi:hypothetical protein
MKNTHAILMTVLAAIVVGAGSFYGGIKYQQKKTVTANAERFGQAGFGANGMMRGQGGNRSAFGGGNFATGTRPIMGSILSQDAKSITVKLPDGSSRIVLLSSTTAVDKATQATVMDMKMGDTVRVFGTTNSDGSITAISIQLSQANVGTVSATPPATQ